MKRIMVLLILIGFFLLFVACPISKVSLTVTIEPEGAGTTIPENSSTFEVGEEIEIEAIASLGYAFERWGGDLLGAENPTNLAMNFDRVVTVHFIEFAFETIFNSSFEVDPETVDEVAKTGK